MLLFWVSVFQASSKLWVLIEETCGIMGACLVKCGKNADKGKGYAKVAGSFCCFLRKFLCNVKIWVWFSTFLLNYKIAFCQICVKFMGPEFEPKWHVSFQS